MDAKERLRLYLEQRRDSGETELVLDSMSVDDVLRVLGAGVAARNVGSARSTMPGVVKATLADSAEAVGEGSPSPAGWREALLALKPAATPAAKPTALRKEGPPRSDAERAPSPPAASPPAAPLASPIPDVATTFASERSERPVSLTVVPLEQVPVGLVVGSAVHELFGGATAPLTSLDDVAQAASTCTRCSLYKSAKHAVPGEGNPDADFVCVGEAPGANEDEQGRPFVGVSGQLLTKILAAIDLTRDDVFICNVLKHRPPGNRNPLPDEVTACSPYLVRQIELIKPKVIVAFGTFAAQTLLQSKEPLGKLRGMIHRYYGVPLIVTYHPAALLRNPSWKRPTWEDVQLARRILDRASSA
ncbi:MAG: uracil-DNA glycosylase [Gemmatimonadaceae bacterium]|nr:uracil-DNA glycosylase [Gemmatimonadaceae bacterium]